LGFAYQLAFVRLHHHFPAQQPLEIDDEIVTYVSVVWGVTGGNFRHLPLRQDQLNLDEIPGRYLQTPHRLQVAFGGGDAGMA
jgi:hypothetical protein